jgi:chromosome segregation ATPase
MEYPEVLKSEIESAKKELDALARQNIDFNAEIVRLKASNDEAISYYADSKRKLDAVNGQIDISNNALVLVRKQVSEGTDKLKAISDELKSLADIVAKEKQGASEVIEALFTKRAELQKEINSLQTQSFNASVTINTQNFTISENERKVSKSKNELSSIERQLQVAKDSLNNEIPALQSKKDTLDRSVVEMRKTLEAYADEVNAKKSELVRIINEISTRESESKESARVRSEQLNKRESDIVIKENKISDNETIIQKTRTALSDREKELKLLELKIKELARKKDIDAQIATLS